MNRTITVEWLKEMGACPDAIEAFKAQDETDAIKLLRLLQQRDKHEWFFWLAAHLMTEQQKVQWAVFCAEQVIGLFEKKRPNDSRPGATVEAVKVWMKDQSEINRQAVLSAAYTAADAAYGAAQNAKTVDDAASAVDTVEAADAADAAARTAYAAYFAPCLRGNTASWYASTAACSAAKAAPEKIQFFCDEAVKILQSEEAL